MDITITGLEDVAAYPALFTELARRGYSQAALEKLTSRNMLRVLKAAKAAGVQRVVESPDGAQKIERLAELLRGDAGFFGAHEA